MLNEQSKSVSQFLSEESPHFECELHVGCVWEGGDGWEDSKNFHTNAYKCSIAMKEFKDNGEGNKEEYAYP